MIATGGSQISLHQLSLYNTGRMSSEQVIAAFAARRPLLERILADLAAEKAQSRAQHHLIVGQRGMGKTMLLARIAAELHTDPKLGGRFIPLMFAEEQYAVDRLSKFWLNCLDSLADARERADDAVAVDAIDATVARLTATAPSAKQDQPYADEVYSAFAKAAQSTGQRPVLLVDNLQIVFSRLDSPQQHSLRELLMRPGAPILIGTSTSPPVQTQEYGAPFYDHFKTHYLRPLEEAEMRELLLHLADVAQRDDVRQRVLNHPARLTVLRQLTGGNPRTTLTLFFLYAEDFAPSVFGDLEGLLDRVTPLYKARFEELTDQQQVITSAIANNWDPITGHKLAKATVLPTSTISAQLDRLEKIGTIERVELFGESRTGYQIAERFFNIWFLMRSASRRQRREVEFLPRFLESFYLPQERTLLAKSLIGESRISPDRYLWSRAVQASLAEPETAEELNRHTQLLALRERNIAGLQDLIDFDTLPKATLAFDDLRQRLEALIPFDAAVSQDAFASAVLGDITLFTIGGREKLAAQTEQLSSARAEAILDALASSQSVSRQMYSDESVAWFSTRICQGQLLSFDDEADWRRAFMQANTKKQFELMLDTAPIEVRESLDAHIFERIRVKLEPENGNASDWYEWACRLHIQLARFAGAEGAYLKTLRLDGSHARALNNLGSLLHRKFERFDEAQKLYRKSIEKNPKLMRPRNNLGALLLEKYQRYEEAEVAFREATSCDGSSVEPWFNLGWVLADFLSRPEEAEIAYKNAIARAPKDVQSWNGLGNLYCDTLDRFDDASAAYERVLLLKPGDEIALQNRLFLRRDYLGEGIDARPLFEELKVLTEHECADTMQLQEALFSAYERNWGLTAEALSQAVKLRSDGFITLTSDDWQRASAVLIYLGYIDELLEFVDQLGDTATRLRPWVEALRALQIGDRRALANVAPEIRVTAEHFYDGIERRLSKLPESTKNRRPSQALKKTPKRRTHKGGRQDG